MINDQIRAEFEAYAEQRNWSTRQNNGSYYWADAARAWQVWQAAYQAGRKAEREELAGDSWTVGQALDKKLIQHIRKQSEGKG